MAPGGIQYHQIQPAPVTYGNLDFSAEDQVSDENDLKIEINTFVWGHAPAAMPIGKADEMACKIFELFIAAREEHKAESLN